MAHAQGEVELRDKKGSGRHGVAWHGMVGGILGLNRVTIGLHVTNDIRR